MKTKEHTRDKHTRDKVVEKFKAGLVYRNTSQVLNISWIIVQSII